VEKSRTTDTALGQEGCDYRQSGRLGCISESQERIGMSEFLPHSRANEKWHDEHGHTHEWPEKDEMPLEEFPREKDEEDLDE
jgi:hypothetical protein